METGYKTVVLKCEEEREGSDIFLLELELPEGALFNVRPGQFIVLNPENSCSVMPRPFSVVDVKNGVVSVLIKVVGKNTRIYSEFRQGKCVDISKPLGLPIPIDLNDESFILVGGSIGGAALVLQAKELGRQEKRLAVLLGAWEEAQLSGVEYFKKYSDIVEIITEIGDGETGFATDLLEKMLTIVDGSTVITCGPKPMLKKVAEICVTNGNKCIVMLEEVMACGVGSCKGCAVPMKDGSIKHVCCDGPAFLANEIDWNIFVPESVVKIQEIDELPHDAMRVEIDELELEYPTMNASGCLSIEALENGHFDYSKIGALVTKGVTLEPRSGNIMPRTCETPSGMINSIGLENLGVEKFISDELPRWLEKDKPVYVNISGFNVDEYMTMAMALNDTDIAGFEINISCPNLKKRKIFGTDPELSETVTRVVRSVTDKTLIVKLTPNVTNIVEIAKAVERAGADAVSLINTVQAMSIDTQTRKPKIGMVTGGLSGPAVRPIAVRMVHELYSANLGIPIIGMGGIDDAHSALEFFIAGADIVAAGTGGFSKRSIFNDINDVLSKALRSYGFLSVKELTGSLLIDNND